MSEICHMHDGEVFIPQFGQAFRGGTALAFFNSLREEEPMSYHPSRRNLLALTGGLACLSVVRSGRTQPKWKVAALFAGRIDDGGFMESGYRGLVAAREKLGVEIAW